MDIETTNPTDTNATPAPEAAAESGAPRFEELRRMVDAMEQDFVRFYAQGNKAAGTRVRAAMQELKNFAQTVRTEVQSIKNAGKPPAS